MANRFKNSCATRIQSTYRGHKERLILKNELRSSFYEFSNSLKLPKTKVSFSSIETLITQITLFFDSSKDGDYLIWLSGVCLNYKSELISSINLDFKWNYKIGRLLGICLKLIESPGTININPSLRLLETFTETNNERLLKALVLNHRYFEALRTLAEVKIPPILTPSPTPPTPLAESLLDLLKKPLSLKFNKNILDSLTNVFLSPAISDCISGFFLPALKADFNFKEWVGVLADDHNKTGPWLFYSFLSLDNVIHDRLSTIELVEYISVMSRLASSILEPEKSGDSSDDDDDDEEEEEKLEVKPMEELNDEEFIYQGSINNKSDVLRIFFNLIKDRTWVTSIIGVVVATPIPSVLKSICSLVHNILLMDKFALHKFRLLYTLAFRPEVLHKLWSLILNTKQISLVGNSVPLLTILARGLKLSKTERNEIIPPLAVFTSLFGYLLVTIHDTEFYGDEGHNKIWMPFSLFELVPMSLSLRDVSLGLIELAFPETRHRVREGYVQALRSVKSEYSETEDPQETMMCSHLFKVTSAVVRQLYNRDTRRQFCPENHWISDRICPLLDRSGTVSFRRSRIRQYTPFQGLRYFTREELETEGPPLSTKEVRLATALRELPYTIGFNQRAEVFSDLVTKDKEEHQGENVLFLRGPSIHITIRRNFVYEDAFDKLSPDNEPNLRLKMRIQLMNAAGMDEAGIDGGGLFREFLSELLKTAFDPNRGFFRLTKDQRLYPNPVVNAIVEDFIPHYYFIGRMLGKALYENMLVELPLASFFLSKLLGNHSGNLDIDHLQFLDPELYKNLLYLKTYEGNVADLGLDFTVVNEEIGQTKVEELKPDGNSLTVNNENRIEYIHLIADYKLNRQIKAQCNAFRQGLSDVINLDWLRMFSYRELGLLISGAEIEINVTDLQNNTKYSGGYNETHITILQFWRVFSSLEEKDKRSFLKFVTSCSRPPLLGFKELDPPFCIQKAGSESERLPTASTCMNLLKLPDFQDEKLLKEKLMYAIESGAGFELS